MTDCIWQRRCRCPAQTWTASLRTRMNTVSITTCHTPVYAADVSAGEALESVITAVRINALHCQWFTRYSTQWWKYYSVILLQKNSSRFSFCQVIQDTGGLTVHTDRQNSSTYSFLYSTLLVHLAKLLYYMTGKQVRGLVFTIKFQ